MTDIEQRFYEEAARELASKQVVVGVMAKAYSDCDGDENKAKALYIKLRVVQLAQQYQEQQQREQMLARERAEQRASEERKARREHESQSRVQEVKRREEAERRDWENGKILAHGDLCGQCQHFKKTGFLDLFAGFCKRRQLATYKNFSCSDYLKRE